MFKRLSILVALCLRTGSFVKSNAESLPRKTIANPFGSIEATADLKWTSCYGQSPATKAGSISCARLLAPLDYNDDSKGQVHLAILRLQGTGNGSAVFYNPGGPGADPIEDVFNRAELLRVYIGEEFDIVVVVPRGVGATFPPMTCDATEYQALQRIWETDDTLPGYKEGSLVDNYVLGKSVGLDCNATNPNLIPYSGTVFVAQDMDRVRKALGQEKLSYYGTSYGTVLGGTYAALFPDRVGQMVLDGVLDFNDYYAWDKDPALDIGDADAALENFFQACHDAGKKACPIWSKDVADIRAKFMKADQSLYKAPLPVTGYNLLKWPLWRSGVYCALYQPTIGFATLAASTAEILTGQAGPYVEAYLKLVQGAATSTEHWPVDSKTGLKNSPNAGTFISCLDSGGTPNGLDQAQLVDKFTEYQAVSDFFGGVSAQFVLVCDAANLRSKARYTKKFESIVTANPILFVGNTADPTTPIRNARRMSEAYVGSRLLTVNGTGHVSFSATQDPTKCGIEWIAPFFKDGTLPPEGTVCDGMQKPFTAVQ